jgi:cutinase
VVLFGTPDTWIMGLLDRSAPPITIGQNYVAKTLQLCATGDPICFPGGLDRSAHSSYKTNGMADQAADFVGRQLNIPGPAATVLQTAGQVDGDQPAAEPAPAPAPAPTPAPETDAPLGG